MKKVTDGLGRDTTSAVAAYLLAGNHFLLKTLYLIGDPENPLSLWLTDYEAPLIWSYWGTFKPATIKRGQVSTKIGLEVTSLDITYSPPPPTITQSIATASPYQLARLGYYDGWPVRAWTVYMPTPGNANTYGCSELFGGTIQGVSVGRGEIKFSVKSFLYIIDQMVPVNTIEITNTLASFSGAVPPPGLSVIPQLSVRAGAGNTNTVIYGDCTSPSGFLFPDRTLQGGYVVFNAGGTLDLIWSAIQTNFSRLLPLTNQIILYAPLPWPPTPGVDTFYISGPAPVNQGIIQTASVASGGSGYVFGDVVTVAGGTGGTLTVLAVLSGVVVTVGVATVGSGYSSASGVATSGGSGVGLTVDTTVAPYLGFPYVPAPAGSL